MKITPHVLSILLLLSVMQPATASNVETDTNHSIATFEHLIQQNKGRVILIDFWASWCVPCRQSFPWQASLYTKFKPEYFTIISVNTDAQRALAEQFIQSQNSQFTTVFDSRGRLAKKLQVSGMPSSFLIDQSGKIVSKHVGFNSTIAAEIEQQISQLLQ